MPSRLEPFRGYNMVDGGLERAMREQHVTRGLVMLPPGDWYDWGRAANLLPADPKAELTFAQRRDNSDTAPLLSFYDGRPVWIWESGALRRMQR
jgi:hypothetical protein